jgi:gamma-glutamyltranspeptidase/glutathione hydrolase
MISATPSGGWIASSPVIPALGFPLGTRGQMFSLDPEHPNCLQPGKRPRTTLSPSLLLKDGRPFLAFGTPGGDNQDQWTLQFFLNVIDFGMDLQEAIDAPTFHVDHLEGSFYPRGLRTGRLCLERRVAAKARTELRNLGHAITVDDEWSHGLVTAVALDPQRGVLSGAASPRGAAYAAGW